MKLSSALREQRQEDHRKLKASIGLHSETMSQNNKEKEGLFHF